MKKLFSLSVFLLCAVLVQAQYNPSNFTVTNKAMGIAQAVPTDARSYFYDASLFIMRPYQSTAEACSYLNLVKYRKGSFPVYINTGTLQSGGTFTGGTVLRYSFKNGTANADLVLEEGITYTGGLWTNITGSTIKSDSAAMAAYFLRRKDSGVNYVTPFQLGSYVSVANNDSALGVRIDSVKNNYLPLNGGTMTGKIIGTAINTNLFNPVFTTDTSKPSSGQIVIGDDGVPSFLIQDNNNADNYTSYGTYSVTSIYNSKTTQLDYGGEFDYLGLSEVNKPLFKGMRGNRNYSANYDSLTYVQRIYTDKNLDTLYRSGDSLIVFKKNGTRWGIYSPTSTGGGGGTLQQATDAGNTSSNDIEITDYTKGVILRTSDGTRFRLTIKKTGSGSPYIEISDPL